MSRRPIPRGIGNGLVLFVAGAVCGSAALWFYMGSLRGEPSSSSTNLPLPLQVVTINTAPVAAIPAPAADDTVQAPADISTQALPLPPEAIPDAVAAPPSALLPAPPLPPLRELALTIPVAGITAAQLRDTYTDARGQGRRHDAIDIMAATGTPVLAVTDGRIVKFFDSKQGGHTIYQFDPLGEIAYYYAHLDRREAGLAEGQLVKRGQVIGYVGYSGNANPKGPHLHFAIFRLGPEKLWWQGTPVNPYGYLGGR